MIIIIFGVVIIMTVPAIKHGTPCAVTLLFYFLYFHSNKCMKFLQLLVCSVVFLTYNWPLMIMIMKMTMMACSENEKLCSHIMKMKHLFLM